MAEQIVNIHNQNKNGNKFIKKIIRVDLTPMVDLGFLLITFFVFTTTMSTSTVMGMVTPKATDSMHDNICESCVITVLPTSNNKIYYYEGNEKNAIYKTTNYSAGGLRKLLMHKKHALENSKRDAVLIIRPTTTASFGNLVQIIDESKICMYTRYYLDQPGEKDKKNID